MKFKHFGNFDGITYSLKYQGVSYIFCWEVLNCFNGITYSVSILLVSYLAQVNIIIPIIVLLASVYLVIGPIVAEPKIEFFIPIGFIVLGIFVYVPFVYMKYDLPGMSKYITLSNYIYIIILLHCRFAECIYIYSRTVGREFASRPGHTKDHHKNGTNCLPA